MRRSLHLVLVITTYPAIAFASTWTVAPSGGDYSTIQAAIDASAPGDVIRVMPGSYGAFALTKDLAILGVPNPANTKPAVSGISTIDGTAARVAGLKLVRLEVGNCAGAVLLDDLEIQGNTFGSVGCDGALVVRGCANVQLARSVVHGKDGDFYCEGAGLFAENSVVTVVASYLDGGRGWGDDFFGYSGRPAVVAVDATLVVLADTDCFGGDGGTPQILFGGQGGWGSPAVEFDVNTPNSDPRVTVRGNADTQIHGGHAGQGIGGQDAYYVAGGNGGTFTFSGAQHWPNTFASHSVVVVLPAPEEPFSTLVGGDLPLDYKRLSLHGPSGSSTILLASLGTSTVSVPGVLGAVHVDPAAIVATLPLTLTGQDLSVNLTFQLPPSLLGLENFLLTMQAFSAGVTPGGAWFAQNPTFLLLRG